MVLEPDFDGKIQGFDLGVGGAGHLIASDLGQVP